MSDEQDVSPVVRAVTVPVEPEHAFRHFVAEFGDWWPSENTWSGDALEEIVIEPRAGGHCYEVGPFEFRCDRGRVLEIEAPRRILLSWQINFDSTPQPDAAKAGEVEVRFKQESPGFSRVSLHHRAFERCGADGPLYRQKMDGDEGWTYILARYAGYCDIPTDIL